jgi:hypothetical protein
VSGELGGGVDGLVVGQDEGEDAGGHALQAHRLQGLAEPFDGTRKVAHVPHYIVFTSL